MVSTDNAGMTTNLRNRKRPPRYVLVERTQHWRRVGNYWYRDCVVELADGQRRLVGVRDDLVAGAA
jgi:hypothetical protein